MLNTAVVIETDRDRAVVRVERKSACEGCHKASGGKDCAVCGLVGGNRTLDARAINSVGAEVGDTVEIESASSRVLLYAALVFILPIVLAFAGYGIAYLCGSVEWVCAVSAAAGAVAALAVAAIVSRAVGRRRCDVKIIKVINRKEQS